MRTWTLAFLAFAAPAVLLGVVGVDSVLQFAARLLFLCAVLVALLAGIRSATLQMLDGAGGAPAACPSRDARRAGGRRLEDRSLPVARGRAHRLQPQHQRDDTPATRSPSSLRR